MNEDEKNETLLEQGKEIAESMKGQSYTPPKVLKALVDAYNDDQAAIANALFAILRKVKELDDENPKPSLTGLGQVLNEVEALVNNTTMTYIPTPHARISKADMILNLWYIGYEASRIALSLNNTTLARNTNRLCLHIDP